MKDSYLSIKGQNSIEYVIQKSRFIGSAKHITSADEGMQFISEVRAKYSDATHNCYAFIADSLGNEIKYSDAGEPQGTAGLPILEVIKSKKLFETAVVITRYFGGIKLGAGATQSLITFGETMLYIASRAIPLFPI